MADKDKKNNGDRLLVFEPNPEDNRIFSNEDLYTIGFRTSF